MAKLVIDAILDAALDYIKSNATKLCVCNSQPTTYAQATASYKLASVVINSADFGSPADGDSSGRKIQMNAQSSVSIDSTGTAAHVALVKVAGSVLLYVTTTTATGLTGGGKVNVAAWDVEIADPT
ncbi:hypothetical protein LCGC14_0814200 [marine sediment metagenome]|uniref:Uncharacterized protein n=1 Tax=marine sediment metagenome TaxID=412755 RepID=A0A0F9Q613_9ZZZZ